MIVLPINGRGFRPESTAYIDRYIRKAANIADFFSENICVATNSELVQKHVEENFIQHSAPLMVHNINSAFPEFDLVNEIEYCWGVSQIIHGSDFYMISPQVGDRITHIEFGKIMGFYKSYAINKGTACMTAYRKYHVSNCKDNDIHLGVNPHNICLSLQRVGDMSGIVNKHLNVVCLGREFLDRYVRWLGVDENIPLMRVIENHGVILTTEI